MRKRPEAPAQGDEVAELRREIADLRDHVRLLTDTLDRIHDELTWITRNGFSIQGPLPSQSGNAVVLAPEQQNTRERPIVRGDAVTERAPPAAVASTDAAPGANHTANATGKGRLF
jgi:hypothetical protein